MNTWTDLPQILIIGRKHQAKLGFQASEKNTPPISIYFTVKKKILNHKCAKIFWLKDFHNNLKKWLGLLEIKLWSDIKKKFKFSFNRRWSRLKDMSKLSRNKRRTFDEFFEELSQQKSIFQLELYCVYILYQISI